MYSIQFNLFHPRIIIHDMGQVFSWLICKCMSFATFSKLIRAFIAAYDRPTMWSAYANICKKFQLHLLISLNGVVLLFWLLGPFHTVHATPLETHCLVYRYSHDPLLVVLLLNINGMAWNANWPCENCLTVICVVCVHIHLAEPKGESGGQDMQTN
jgi:hypothetical protein